LAIGVSIIGVALVAPTAAASQPIEVHDVLRLAVLNLPLNGLMLLLLYWIPNLWHERNSRQPAAQHVLLMLANVAMLTFGIGLVDVAVFWDNWPSTVQFVLGMVGVVLLFTVLMARYLGRSLGAAAVGGGVLAAITAAFWFYILRCSDDYVVMSGGDWMGASMPLLMLLFLVMLGLETYLLQARPLRKAEAAATNSATPQPRPWKVAEAWAIAMILAAIVIVIDATSEPIFL